MLLIISNAITVRQDKSILYSRITIQGLITCCIIAFSNLNIKPLYISLGIYGGLFNVTLLTTAFSIFILIIATIILILTSFYPRKIYFGKNLSFYKLITQRIIYDKNIVSNKTGEQFHIIEYPLIIVFILCGAIFLISTADLISVFLSIELQSYGLYIICTLYRDSELATASGLTYFLLGGLSSCFILLGSALLYSISGTTSLDNIYIIGNLSEVFYYDSFLNLALIILLVGFLFKVSAAPFHFWSPDVYDGIPTIVTTFVAIIAKISIFIFFLELVYYTDYFLFNFSWKNILLMSSLLSLLIGSILGLTQFRIKRLFAYSTISHVGFILLALSIDSAESIQSFIFYILQYTISNLNGFLILLTIGFSLYFYVYKDQENLIDKNNSPIQLISQIKGYFHINSFIAVSFAITIFSFIGIPPIIGFFAKQMILTAALDNGYVFMSLVAIITSVIGGAYYLNLVKQIFFFKSDYEDHGTRDNIVIQGYVLYNNIFKSDSSPIHFTTKFMKINSALSNMISIITLLLLLFIFMPEEWFNIISILTLSELKS